MDRGEDGGRSTRLEEIAQRLDSDSVGEADAAPASAPSPMFDLRGARIAGGSALFQLTINNYGGPGRPPELPADTDRQRRLRAIDARLVRVPGGERRLDAFLGREFGGARLADLLDVELERAWAFVCAMPTV